MLVAVRKKAAARLSSGSALLWPPWWPSVSVVWSAEVPFSASRGRLLIRLSVGAAPVPGGVRRWFPGRGRAALVLQNVCSSRCENDRCQ